MQNRWKLALIASTVLLISLSMGCATFRSDIIGGMDADVEKNYGAEKVSVLFVFNHSRQMVGFDAIPKLESQRQILNGFDDILFDALPEIGNLGSYATFTEFSTDVNDPDRRALKDSLMASHDYVISMRIKRETSFSKLFLGSLTSTVSVTVIPVPYTRHFSLDTQVFKRDGSLISEYHHEANVTKWVQTLLLFAYPFHPETRKIEETYVEMLHTVFRQIDGERILVAE